MNITQIRDQIVLIGENVEDVELVNMALNGFPTLWEPFFKSICTWEKIPNFEILWDDYIQEETQMELKAW
jgi:hypothetical protein